MRQKNEGYLKRNKKRNRKKKTKGTENEGEKTKNKKMEIGIKKITKYDEERK